MYKDLIKGIHHHLEQEFPEASARLQSMLDPPTIVLEFVTRPSTVKVFLLEDGKLEVWHVHGMPSKFNKRTHKWFEVDISKPDSLELMTSAIKTMGRKVGLLPKED
jgi:biotin carboxylase